MLALQILQTGDLTVQRTGRDNAQRIEILMASLTLRSSLGLVEKAFDLLFSFVMGDGVTFRTRPASFSAWPSDCNSSSSVNLPQATLAEPTMTFERVHALYI